MFYRRHHPHWQKNGSALFITWRLRGSLPAQIFRDIRINDNAGKQFALLDRELDKASYGPIWLKDARLAQTVVDSLRFGDEHLELYRLSAYVVMTNHVHVLIWPREVLGRITKCIKNYTSRECNRILGTTGQKFWQDESFDHAVRTEEEFYRIKRYIELNPVKAGLVTRPEDWPWSSASH